MLCLNTLEEQTKAFGEKYVAPITQKVDKEAMFPQEAYDALKREGYMGLLVPKEYGGLGGGAIHHAKVCAILGSFDASTSLCYMMHNTATACLAAFGSEELKKDLLPKIAKGEVALALAYSESGSGTHFGLPDITEQEKGDKRVLNGRKSFVTAAKHADFYLTYTNSCKVKGGKNTWVVSRKLPNLVHDSKHWDGLGMRGNSSISVEYNHVEVDNHYLIGKEGDGENQAGLVAMYFVIGLGAVYSGVGLAAYNCILAHTKERKYTSGGTLSDIELVKVHLSDIYTKHQSSIALTYEAARSFDAKESDYAAKIFACRINATHCVMDICTLAMRLGGGKAYAKMLPLERYLRDALASQVMAPSLDILKIWLGQSLTQ